eukprot:scaffold50291_cov20-Tisochrysis_lutea.AAC.5
MHDSKGQGSTPVVHDSKSRHSPGAKLSHNSYALTNYDLCTYGQRPSMGCAWAAIAWQQVLESSKSNLGM